MRAFIILLGVLSMVYANDDYQAFVKAYQNGSFEEYKKACHLGKALFSRGEKDEKFISLIGMACLKADYIDMLGLIQSRLYTTDEGRTNAALFTSILLQKRLILQYMYDDTDISTLALPVADHPLSIVFSAIRDGHYKEVSNHPKEIIIEQDHTRYRVYIDKEKKNKLAIDITTDAGILQEHRYR